MESDLNIKAETFLLIKNATNRCPEMNLLLKTIQNGWPDQKIHLDDSIKKYYNERDEFA